MQLIRSLPIVLAFGATSLAFAEIRDEQATLVSQLKLKSNQWIQLEQKIVEQQANEELELESLAHSIDVLRFLHDELSLAIEQQQNRTGELESQFQAADAALLDRKAGTQRLAEQLDSLQSSLLSLYDLLPDPLQKKISPQVDRLNVSDEDLAARTQALLTILTYIEEFNNSLTLNHDIRQLEDGSRKEVKVLYWGLAFGYAISTGGQQAWRLSPAENGWTWSDASSEFPRIKRLLDIQAKAATPELVSGEVTILDFKEK